jgi:hypothetical protein
MKNDRSLNEMMLISTQSAVPQTLFGKTKPTHPNERLQWMEKQVVRNGSMSWVGKARDRSHYGERPRTSLCPPRKYYRSLFFGKTNPPELLHNTFQ